VTAAPATAQPASTRDGHRHRPRNGPTGALLVLLGLALIVTIAIALGIGSVHIPVETVVQVVARRMRLGDYPVTVLQDQIVWDLRYPRVLGAAATGAGLATVGAVLQSLTRNDLADPYLLGISSGASVGAVSVIVLGVGVGTLGSTVALTAGAFLGALAALVVVLLFATGRSGTLPPARVVLAGVAVGYLCSAYTSFIVMTSGESDAARRVLSWTLGSFAGLRWDSAIFLIVVTLLGLVLNLAFSRDLDAFAFGEASATSLGVPVSTVRWTLMTGTALLTACLVAVVGAIGFVGLVVPHIVRLLAGPGHVRLLPLSLLVGAIGMVWSDTAARSLVAGQEIPVGVITAAIGAPFFVWLLRRAGRES
jgi:iron complex transport system permease protein